VALNILAVLPPDGLARAIAAADTASIARAQGVGPKLAARIANELKSRMGGIALGPAGGPALPAGNRTADDALAALAALGFRPTEAARAVAEAIAELGTGAALNDVVRAALKRSVR
jgi:Holliday junction DNA helicase RuvA